MRTFRLIRKEDVTGISGTGIVAEGLEFTDGTVVMKWLTHFSIVEQAPNIHTIEAVHGHGGSTYVEWTEREAA